MKLDSHNSLAARRKFIGDFTLSTSTTSLLSTSEQLLNSDYRDYRRHHRPADVFPAHILPHLYLGNDDTAKNHKVLNRYGIRHIINVTSNLPNYFEDEADFHYLRIPVDDSSSQNLFQFFPQAISFIERAHADGCSVLVHCWAGLSRSVTVCLAYIMYVMNSPLEEAFDLLLKLNNAIAPNFHFLETLTCWERLLLRERAAERPAATPSTSSSTSAFSMLSDASSSSLPSSSAVSIASSEVSPVSKVFNISELTELDESVIDSTCHYHYNHVHLHNLHTTCFKTASSPTISINLPSPITSNGDYKSAVIATSAARVPNETEQAEINSI